MQGCRIKICRHGSGAENCSVQDQGAMASRLAVGIRHPVKQDTIRVLLLCSIVCVCLSSILNINRAVYTHIYVCTYIHAYIHTCIHDIHITCARTCIKTYISAHIPACLPPPPACLATQQTFMHARSHACVHQGSFGLEDDGGTERGMSRASVASSLLQQPCCLP